MSDDENMQVRIAALEKVMRERPGRKIQLFFLGLLLLVLVFMTLNFWLVNEFVERMIRTDKEHLFWVLCQPGFSTDERKDAFIQLLATGNTEWRSARLSRLNLKEADLAGADLQLTDLRKSDLSKADLSGARLTDSLLGLADLTEADLSKTNLERSDFFNTTLIKARLSQANLRAANLQQVIASDAHFTAANLSEANLLMGVFIGANFSGANLTDATLDAANFSKADFSLVRLTGSTLVDADFTDCNWWRARGMQADQVALLMEKYAPGKDSKAGLLEDYEKWLNDITVSHGNP